MRGLTKIFTGGKDAPSVKAAELADLLRAAEAEQLALREREKALSAERVQALLGADDAEVDRIEAELATVQRSIDRHDVRIPEMRRLHTERRAQEETASNEREFSAAVTQRIAVAGKIDAALADLGRLFDEFDSVGAVLSRLQPYHQADKLGTPMGEYKADQGAVKMALLLHAPRMAAALRLEAWGPERPGAFGEAEGEFWNRVADRVRARAVNKGEAA